MDIDTGLKKVYDNLIRRCRLLECKGHQTSKHPISLRLSDVEKNLVDDMGFIFGLNRSTIIKLCIHGAAQQLAEDERNKRFNASLRGE